jgi:hypothetical protein
MSSLGRNPGVSRLLALIWLVTWLLTVPLFHIHALDSQESFSRSQVFLTHTVFTPDLPGEYAASTAVHQRGTRGNERTLSSHLPRYSEIAFSLLCEDDETKRKIGIQSIHCAHISSLRPAPLDFVRYVIPQRASPPFLLLASALPSRSPPFVSC